MINFFKTIFLTALLVAVIIVAYFAVLFGVYYFQERSTYNRLAELIDKNDRIKIQEAANFEWDKFFVFGPYTPRDRIIEALGYEWEGAYPMGLEYDENQFLVFTKDGLVVMTFIFPRAEGDFIENLHKNNLLIWEYYAEDAIFTKKDDNLLIDSYTRQRI